MRSSLFLLPGFPLTLGAPAVFPFLVFARACRQGWCWPQDAIVPLGGLVGVAIAATIGIRKWKTGGLDKYVGGLWVVVFVHPFVLWPLHQALPKQLVEQTAYFVGAFLLATITAAFVLTGIWVLRAILK